MTTYKVKRGPTLSGKRWNTWAAAIPNDRGVCGRDAKSGHGGRSGWLFLNGVGVICCERCGTASDSPGVWVSDVTP